MKGIVISMTLLVTSLLSNDAIKGMKAYGERDYLKAKELYSNACDKKDRHGCFLLGEMYFNGYKVRYDIRKAKELFGKACDYGYFRACERYKTLNK